MAINFSVLDYLPNYEAFSRTAIFTPLVSAPGAPAYTLRGIFSTRELEMVGEDGSIISEQQTILDIREIEFSTLPMQKDQVEIPECDGLPAEGVFEIKDSSTNGGGETTLVLRKVKTAKP